MVRLNGQTQCWAGIKLTTDNLSTVLTRNLRNPRDHAPLSAVHNTHLIHLMKKSCRIKSVHHERCDTMELWDAALAFLVLSSFN